ncbi:GFA family protein [Falsihalocynthiibacter sp. S25ZX9]|uniref:GFA family protein n=1 Tax=Falsihalocynthiibacter sp. S25ZX9 TaxID=3240870 RepID=UPI00350ED766
MRGSCLCGGVSFELEGEMRDPIACHCSQCRKTSGHYWAATAVPSNKLKLLSDSSLAWYRSSDYAQRGFCNKCGSSLFWKMEGEDKTSIGAGALEAPTDFKIKTHIFTEDKGDYYEIEEGPEQLAKY